MTNEQIKVATSAAIEQTKRQIAASGRVYPVPMAGSSEARAEVERFDVKAVGLRMRAMLAGIVDVRLPGGRP